MDVAPTAHRGSWSFGRNPQKQTMRYQLVMQFRGDSLTDYDQLNTLEDRLIEALGDSADVDGHDIGSGETNLFIFTSDPVATFRQARPLLQSMEQLERVTAAFREINGKQFTVIWPEDSTGEFTVARGMDGQPGGRGNGPSRIRGVQKAIWIP